MYIFSLTTVQSWKVVSILSLDSLQGSVFRITGLPFSLITLDIKQEINIMKYGNKTFTMCCVTSFLITPVFVSSFTWVSTLSTNSCYSKSRTSIS